MLPDWLKTILQKLGVNTVRLEWKLRDWRERLRQGRTPFSRWRQTLSYEHKYCTCGALVDKNARVCPHCGENVGSRTSYRIGRALGFITPGAGFVWAGFLLLVGLVFMVELLTDGLRALGNPSSEMLIRIGLFHSELVNMGQYWRFFSAGIVHIGLIHILFNTIAISQLAPPLEEENGPWQFLVLITFCQLTTTLTGYVWYDVARSAGASGIAFGLIGFGIAYTQRTAGPSHPMRDLYMKWALYGFIFSILVPGIDIAGHAGGFLGGLVFGFVLPTTPAIKERLKGLWIPLGVLCLVIWGYTLYSMVQFMRATADLNLTEIERMLNRMQ